MSFDQGQIDELLRLITQRSSSAHDIISELLKDRLNENNVMVYIRKGLSDSERYDDTLKFFNSIILKFSKDVLRDNLVLFMDTILSNRKECGVKFQFLSTSLRHCRFDEEMNKSKVLPFVPKIIEKCIGVDKNRSYETESLSCLATCLELCPSTCGPFKSKIEKYLLQYLRYDADSYAVEQAAKCFHYLQQCGPSGKDSENHIRNWSETLTKICATFKESFECVLDVNHSFNPNRDGITLLPLVIDNSENSKLFGAELTVLNLLVYLKKFIELKYPCPKKIKPYLIVELLDFCLNKQFSSDDSIEAYCSNSAQMRIEAQLFYMFRSFVALMKFDLIPFSNVIMKILTDRLQETRDKRFKYNSEYKQALYKLISHFVKVMRNNVGAQFHKKLVEAILDDITPITESVTLSLPNNNISIKARQIITENQTISSANRKDNKGGSDAMIIKEKICCSALDTLTECFKSITLSIEYNLMKHIYKILCKTLTSIQNGITTLPYVTPTSTSKLYEVLVASLEQIHPPPLQIVLNLLLVGQSLRHADVSSGIMLIEKICQPVRPLVFSTISSENFMGDTTSDLVTFEINENVENTSAIGNLPSEINPEVFPENSREINVDDGDSNDEDVSIEETIILEENLNRDFYSPPRKVSRQEDEGFDDITVEEMLASFKDVPTLE